MERDAYKAARVLAKLTDAQLAAEARMHVRTIRRFMDGEPVSDETRAKIDAALLRHGVTVHQGRAIVRVEKRQKGKDDD